MPGKFIPILVLGFCFFSGIPSGKLRAQLPTHILRRAEFIQEENEEGNIDPEILASGHSEIKFPLDLNQASSATLEASGLFTAYQLHSLREYQERHGPLLSIYELAGIKGFRKDRLMEIEDLIIAGAGNLPQDRPKTSIQSRVFLSRKYPLAEEYALQAGQSAPTYAGSPLHAGLRLAATLPGNLSAGLAAGKDPGERLWDKGKAEFLGGYLHYSPGGKLKQVILGRYLLQSGLGLVHGSGQFHGSTGFHQDRIYRNDIRPYGGGREWGVQQGMATSIRFSSMEIRAWLSLRNPDISLHGLESESSLQITEHLRQEGLHRTRTEREGRDLAWLAQGGMQINWQWQCLELGLLSSNYLALASQALQDSLSVKIPGQWKHAIGLQGRWQAEKLELFGELVPGPWERSAFQSGFRYPLNDFLQTGGLLYYFGGNYTALDASAFAASSSLENQRGFLVHLHAGLCKWLEAEASLQAWSSPLPRHGNLLPSSGSMMQLDLQTTEISHLRASLRLRKKISEGTPASESNGFRETERNNLLGLDARLVYAPSHTLDCTLRLLIRHLPDQGRSEALVLQCTYRLKESALVRIQALGYRIPHWDLRVAIYEPGLYRHFSFPVYNGNGQRFSLYLSWKLRKRLVLEARYSMHIKVDVAEEVLSQELALQMRLRI